MSKCQLLHDTSPICHSRHGGDEEQFLSLCCNMKLFFQRTCIFRLLMHNIKWIISLYIQSPWDETLCCIFCSAGRLRLSLQVNCQTDDLGSDMQLVACMLSSRRARAKRMAYFFSMQLLHTACLDSTAFRMGCPFLFLPLLCL
jgi:hypothetical protein